jgi:hypothetical protein
LSISFRRNHLFSTFAIVRPSGRFSKSTIIPRIASTIAEAFSPGIMERSTRESKVARFSRGT